MDLFFILDFFWQRNPKNIYLLISASLTRFLVASNEKEGADDFRFISFTLPLSTHVTAKQN